MSRVCALIVLPSLSILIAVYFMYEPVFHSIADQDSVIKLSVAPGGVRSGLYMTYRVESKKHDFPLGNSVTILTHCSANNLKYIAGLAERWDGPISIAVITNVSAFNVTLDATRNLIACYPSVRKHVQFHITTTSEIQHDIILSAETSIPCADLMENLIDQFKDKNYALDGLRYPINVLKNVGRLGVSTNFHITMDIDMLPNAGLYSRTAQMLKAWEDQQSLRKTAFVLPVFEVEEHWQVPANKDELLSAIDEGYVRGFYEEICPHCQLPIDVPRWKKFRENLQSVAVAYYKDYSYLWEPLLITHTNAPLHDERFVQYGFDRAIHTCELHVAGFSFAVLDQGFLVHQGFKRHGQFHDDKNKENAENHELFRNTLQTLKKKYPDTKRTCERRPGP